MILISLFGYFTLLVLAGIVLYRKNKNFDDYFFAGRKLGSLLIFFTVTASWFGAASTLATFDDSLKNGFRSIWLLAVPTLATIMIFVLLNRKIRQTRFVSLPDLLKKRYGALVALLASYLIYIYMTLLAASQFVAWGNFVGPVLNGERGLAILLGALIVILYSYIGGYLSVVLTDGLQFFLLISAVVILLLFFLKIPLPAAPLDFHILGNIRKNLLMTLSFTLAWIISPIVWQRIASAKSGRASRRGLLLSAAVIILLYTAIITTAISVRDIPGVGLFHIIQHYLPHWAALPVFLGIAAAIMSTADTALNLGALTLVRDITTMHSSRRLMDYSRVATIITGLLAVVVAVKFKSIIRTLGLASEIMAEGLFIPGMAALFLRKTKPLAGLLSLSAGGLFAIAVFLRSAGLPVPVPLWPESLPIGLLLSLSGFLLGTLLDGKAKDLK